jgi:hypothetical protein
MNRWIAAFVSLALAVTFIATAIPAAAEVPTSCLVKAGPIWNQPDANVKCPTACGKGYGPWNGMWWTTKPSEQSVCICGTGAIVLEAGPIGSDQKARQTCPKLCTGKSAAWSSHWWTTEEGKMSVCLCSSYCPPQP